MLNYLSYTPPRANPLSTTTGIYGFEIIKSPHPLSVSAGPYNSFDQFLSKLPKPIYIPPEAQPTGRLL